MADVAVDFDPKKDILILGAKLHNLKNISVKLPKNQLIVVTGLSGSGKSTLAFDTLYAEGQRRYVESLSSYARQFMGRLDKPQVDDIKGIAPAIAIQQKVNTSNPRSTVGTSTEVYDYMKLLYARVGRTYSPISGEEVTKDDVTSVLDYLKQKSIGDTYVIGSALRVPEDREFLQHLQIMLQQGFARLEVQGQMQKIEDLIAYNFAPQADWEVNVIIDRVVLQEEEGFWHRLGDSVQTAFYEGGGEMFVRHAESGESRVFSDRFSLDGMEFTEPNVHFFSFNTPFGACPVCEGYGKIIGIDEQLVIPNPNLSIYNEAVVAWKGEKMGEWKEELIRFADKIDIPIHKPYHSFTDEQKKTLWRGKGKWVGLDGFFKMLEENTYKIQYRVMLSRYRGKTLCTSCQGKRLRPETEFVKIGGRSITDLVVLPLDELKLFFDELQLSDYDFEVAKRILTEINNRLQVLLDVGLHYLTLNRNSNTLSGGESQRINLATSLGSNLVGSMYILDEPSIGLHSRDTERLIGVLKELRDLGNTVIVVEHDEDMMREADFLVDIGPLAGSLGGEVVFAGDYKALLKSDTLTAQYLNGELEIPVPKKRRKVRSAIEIKGARGNNLKGIDVMLPLDMVTVITGVSGSGKSTLLKEVVIPALQKELGIYNQSLGNYEELSGSYKKIEAIEWIDQNPIGKSSRSNPVTYTKAYDDIRTIFAKEKLSAVRGYKTKHFSFNVEGGRCETCQGEGSITISMQFMADVTLPCEDCKGLRFKSEILDVKYHDKHIADVLAMTVDEALAFFGMHGDNKVADKLQTLHEVGLGYVQLGQSSSSLSGGEAQRIKLASFLTKGSTNKRTLFVFDEPSTGLHFSDVNKLMNSINALIDNGHTVWIIEHHMDIIKSADYVIDLGPDGGKNGGELVFAGTPEGLVENPNSFTGKYLKEKLP
ncbi:MAG: excinuclease ABC subunit UvrA [Weeksellaceae bacterium]|nr:excinuclease ABC subunit UvrA [Weeksellaceae bacterium]